LPVSSTVLLHFIKSEIPLETRIGCLNFKTRQYIPKPIRCFKCNRFGHVASHCRGKEECSKCGEEHNWALCTVTESTCPNCRGNHSANDRSCPRYKCEEEVLKIKSENNITYAEAVKNTAGTYQALLLPRSLLDLSFLF